MSLRSKVLASVIGAFSCYLVAAHLVQQAVVLPKFVTLERRQAEDDLRRCQEAIDRELQHLAVACHDWAAWDDMYQYVADRSEEWARGNLANSNLENAGLNLMFILDRRADPIYGNALELDSGGGLRLEAFPLGRWPEHHPLLAHRCDDELIKTILITEVGPMLVASRPIVHTDGKGPANGVLVFGRLLDQTVLDQLREQTRVDFRIWPIGSTDMPAKLQGAVATLAGADDALMHERDDDTLEVQSILTDHAGRPVLAVRALVPRYISAQGRAVVDFALGSLALAGGGTALLLLVLLGAIVGRPLRSLTDHVTHIGASGDLRQRLGMMRQDEFGVLAREFDRMVSALAESRAQLTETSRLAGMADVAGGILHNVGNVLNHLNTSTWVITDSLRNSRLSGLAKAAELLTQHENDLDDFVTRDQRGKQVPAYITQLAGVLAAEQQQMLAELEKLRVGVNHVNEIIQAQNKFARASGVAEPTSLEEVIETSLSIMESGFLRHGIRVEKALDEVPLIPTDRSKLLQILVNLLTNAKDAIRAQGGAERLVAVALRREGECGVMIEVTDSGIGIAPEDTVRIFANGFTTKPEGSGYGLHYSALSAKQLGGTLEVRSAGSGRGATFVFRIPVTASESMPTISGTSGAIARTAGS
jgi:sensor domain CHASE-containing protein